ncbi:MAG: hypothetical protein ACI86C_000013 [Candidatus Latescibacterota bacterium]|jgi:uncharacterized protein YkwD
MKLIKTCLLAIVVLFTVASCSKDSDVNSDSEVNYTIDLDLTKKTDWDMANEILILINDHRTSIGVDEILLDETYASAYAVGHTDYMIDTKQVNHDNFSERQAGLESRGAKAVGENVAYGYTTAEGVVSAWLNSPGHRQTIEEDYYTHTGFGIFQSEENRYYFTQIFYKE